VHITDKEIIFNSGLSFHIHIYLLIYRTIFVIILLSIRYSDFDPSSEKKGKNMVMSCNDSTGIVLVVPV
jgi:hypothetical protein